MYVYLLLKIWQINTQTIQFTPSTKISDKIKLRQIKLFIFLINYSLPNP